MKLLDQPVAVIEAFLKKEGGVAFAKTIGIGRSAANYTDRILTDAENGGSQLFEDRFDDASAHQAQECLLHLANPQSCNFLKPLDGEIFRRYLRRYNSQVNKK